MKFSLPGQLRGPECRRVISQAIALRRILEPLFENIEHKVISEFAIILRVDGSLGSFGPEGVKKIKISKGTAQCDLVIRDHNWDALNDDDIKIVLKKYLSDCINVCVQKFEIKADLSEISNLLIADT